MANEDSKYYKDWFQKAEQDWNRVEILLKANDTEGAGFHLQQSLEKYLKGFLLSKGWKLQRIHDLEKLINGMNLGASPEPCYAASRGELNPCLLVRRSQRRKHFGEGGLNIAIKHAPELETFRPICEQVTEYYTNIRYPIFIQYTPTVEEINEVKNTSSNLVNPVRKAVIQTMS